MDIHYIERPEGRLAFSLEGTGPLVIATPGMGDLRDGYRDLAAALIAAGYRVALVDLPGHGDSDISFTRFGDIEIGGHLLALIEQLGGPAVLVGNSLAGSAAAWASAQSRSAIAGLVLSSPFLREPQSPRQLAANRLLYRVLLAGPWGPSMWASLYRSSFAQGRKPAWFDEHVSALKASLRRPGRMAALRTLAVQLDHTAMEEVQVTAPSLTVVGALDPDYDDPATELAYLAERTGGATTLVDDAAHYAHFQAPDVVTPLVLDFLSGLRDGANWAARA